MVVISLSDIQAAEDCLCEVSVHFVRVSYGLIARRNLETTFVSCVTNKERETYILRT